MSRSGIRLARTSHRSLCLARQSLDLVEHFVVLRESANVLLAPNLLAVHVHVEHAAGTFDHPRIDAELILDRLRQTGGRGVIVSLHAVLDGDVHAETSPSHPNPKRQRGAGPVARAPGSDLRQIHRHQELGVGADLGKLGPQ